MNQRKLQSESGRPVFEGIDYEAGTCTVVEIDGHQIQRWCFPYSKTDKIPIVGCSTLPAVNTWIWDRCCLSVDNDGGTANMMLSEEVQEGARDPWMKVNVRKFATNAASSVPIAMIGNEWEAPTSGGNDALGNVVLKFTWKGAGAMQAGKFPSPGHWLYDRLILKITDFPSPIPSLPGRIEVTLSKDHVVGWYAQLNYPVLEALLVYVSEGEIGGENGAVTGYASIDLDILKAYPAVRIAYDQYIEANKEVIAAANKVSTDAYNKWLEEFKKTYPCYDPNGSATTNFLCGFKVGFVGFYKGLGEFVKTAVETAADIGGDLIKNVIPTWLLITGGLILVLVVAVETKSLVK